MPASPGASPEHTAPASPATAQGLGTGTSKQSPQMPGHHPRIALRTVPASPLTVPQGQSRSIHSTSNPITGGAGVRGAKRWQQQHSSSARGIDFLGSSFPCISLIYCAPSLGLLSLWEHRQIVPSLWDADGMLHVMWKTLLAAPRRWLLAKLH